MTDREALKAAVVAGVQSGDRSAAIPYSDYLAEHGLPGARLYQEWANQHNQPPIKRAGLGGPWRHWMSSKMQNAGISNDAIHGALSHGGETFDAGWTRASEPHHALISVDMPADEQGYAPDLYVRPRSKQHARHLISDLPEHIKAHFEEHFIPHLPDEPVKLARPSISRAVIGKLHDLAVNKHKNFVSTPAAPSPGLAEYGRKPGAKYLLHAKALGRPQDFHDTAAVLAGSKPAALIDADWLDSHPVGKVVRQRLLSAGHTIAPAAGGYAVGQAANVNALQAEYAKNTGVRRPGFVGALNHRIIGRALGYSPEAIDAFHKSLGEPYSDVGSLHEIESQKLARSQPYSVTALESAVRLDPENATLWSLLATAYIAAGEQGKAATASALAGLYSRKGVTRFARSKAHAAIVRLLKPKPGDTLTAKHLTGEAFTRKDIIPAPKVKPKPVLDFSFDAMDSVPKGPGPRGRAPNEPKATNPTLAVVNKRYSVDPQIAGTALAYHLRQIAQAGAPDTAALAEYALAGRTPPGVNGDVYRALGRRLARAKHPLATAYNWDRMSEGLSVDNWLEKFIRKNVVNTGHPDNEYFDKVRAQFGAGRNGRNRAYDAFWSRLERAAAADNFVLSKRHKDDFKQAVEDAMHRISDRHLDRAYLAAKGDTSLLASAPRGAARFARTV